MQSKAARQCRTLSFDSPPEDSFRMCLSTCTCEFNMQMSITFTWLFIFYFFACLQHLLQSTNQSFIQSIIHKLISFIAFTHSFIHSFRFASFRFVSCHSHHSRNLFMCCEDSLAKPLSRRSNVGSANLKPAEYRNIQERSCWGPCLKTLSAPRLVCLLRRAFLGVFCVFDPMFVF